MTDPDLLLKLQPANNTYLSGAFAYYLLVMHSFMSYSVLWL